jgi:hypothetical protein
VPRSLCARILAAELIKGRCSPSQHVLPAFFGQPDELRHNGNRQMLREIRHRVERAALDVD